MSSNGQRHIIYSLIYRCNMRLFFIFTLFLSIFTQGCTEEHELQPVTNVVKNSNPRLVELNPRAWEKLPMEVVISDFQQSDGIFSSFICDEIIKRLSSDSLSTLKELNTIDVASRTYAFKICMSPEYGEGSIVLEPISKYANQYTELVNEIIAATQ